MSTIKAIAEYAMQSRKQALLVAIPLACLPFLNWAAFALVVLITLRLGAREGLIVGSLVVIPSVVLSLFLGPPTLLLTVILGNLFIWLVACVLRETGEWSDVLWVGVLTAILGVIVLHVVFPDTGKHWQALLQKDWDMYAKTTVLPVEQQKQLYQTWTVWFLPMATGIQATVLFVTQLLSLLMGRWLQALLYNPGGLSRELSQVRMSKNVLLILLMGAAALLMWPSVGIDALPVLLFAPLCMGISLVHALLARKVRAIWKLILFYVSLVFFFPYLVIILSLTAMLDSWFDFRARQN